MIKLKDILNEAFRDYDLRRKKALGSKNIAVLKLAMQGYSTKNICSALKISDKTVEFHKARAMRLLGLRTLYDVIVWGIKNKWIEDPPITDDSIKNISPKELQVLQLTIDGKNTKEIASDLNMKDKNIEKLRSNVVIKFNIQPRTMAKYIRFGFQIGLKPSANIGGGGRI